MNRFNMFVLGGNFNVQKRGQRSETAARNMKMLKGEDSSSNGTISSGEFHMCYACRKSNHLADKCHFRAVKSHNCGNGARYRRITLCDFI